MTDIVYECAVNNTHPQKKFAVTQTQPPVCCQRPMILLKAAAPSLASQTAPMMGKSKHASAKATPAQKK